MKLATASLVRHARTLALPVLLLFGAGIAGCAEAKFVGFHRCMPDSSQVWWLFPNASGTYEGSISKPDYCGTS